MIRTCRRNFYYFAAQGSDERGILSLRVNDDNICF